MINVHNVSKSYKEKKTVTQALRDVSLQVNDGELFGVIGPDGAGKTTLIRLLTTLLLPDTGSLTVQGYDTVNDFKNIRTITGYMPGRFSLYHDLTVSENLNFFASIFNTSVQEHYNLIKDIYVQLEPFKDRPAGKLSGGMKQKLALCCALIHKPSVLFLDEPTTGVDAVSRQEFWQMLHRLKAEGITIMVSTPYMDEAGLCDRVALMHQGVILQIDTPQHIAASYPAPLISAKADDMYNLLHQLKIAPEVQGAYAFGTVHHAVLNQQVNPDHWMHNYNIQHPDVVLSKAQPDIEDAFIYLIKTHEYEFTN